jgi:hypothetical protein
MRARKPSFDDSAFERYRAIEYGSDAGPVMIIQDTETDTAWIQSDTTRNVEP